MLLYILYSETQVALQLCQVGLQRGGEKKETLKNHSIFWFPLQKFHIIEAERNTQAKPVEITSLSNTIIQKWRLLQNTLKDMDVISFSVLSLETHFFCYKVCFLTGKHETPFTISISTKYMQFERYTSFIFNKFKCIKRS